MSSDFLIKYKFFRDNAMFGLEKNSQSEWLIYGGSCLSLTQLFENSKDEVFNIPLLIFRF